MAKPWMEVGRYGSVGLELVLTILIPAGIGHWLLGSVDFQVFGLLILGSVPGILLGSYAAVRIPERALRLVLAATLIAVATKLSFGLFPSSGNVVAVQAPAPH